MVLHEWLACRTVLTVVYFAISWDFTGVFLGTLNVFTSSPSACSLHVNMECTLGTPGIVAGNLCKTLIVWGHS